MKVKNICVLGGSGFVGRHLAAELSERGCQVRVLSRRPERHRALLVLPAVTMARADVQDPAALVEHFAGCDAVVNLVGILNETRPGDFRKVHAELPGKVARACLEAGVPRLLHMSALNADAAEGPSEYLRTKGDGEERAHALGGEKLAVTSFRPSVVFGPDDTFFNRFALYLNLSLAMPLACCQTRFAPVYVGDVARAFANALENRATFGSRCALCGPREQSLEELVNYTARVAGQKRLVVGLGDGLSALMARVLALAPGKPMTYDNYLSMKKDCVAEKNDLPELGVTPTDMDAVVPQYLGKGDRHGRFAGLRGAAGRDG